MEAASSKAELLVRMKDCPLEPVGQTHDCTDVSAASESGVR